jgi:hypothetical protein
VASAMRRRDPERGVPSTEIMCYPLSVESRSRGRVADASNPQRQP